PPIVNSLKYASLSTVVDLVLGVAIAYVVVRTPLAGRHVLDAVAMLPLAVPGLVLAFGYLAMTQEASLSTFVHGLLSPLSWMAAKFGAQSWLTTLAGVEKTLTGFLLRNLNPTLNPTALLVIAYSIRRLPYVVRSAAAGLQQTSVTLEEAA